LGRKTGAGQRVKIDPGMSRAYFNQRAEIWDETVAEKDSRKLQEMSWRLNIRPGSSLLDVGTGTGIFLPFLLSQIGRHGWIIALDFAEKMLRKARAKGFRGDIGYLLANVSNIPLHDEVFDVTVCYSSFPHFPDKAQVLVEIKRVLKPGGQLFICHTSSRAKINEIHRQSPPVKNDLLPDEAEMQLLLREAGFTEITIADASDSYFCQARKPPN
jgi:ubiquinone/menaquinone biosynthesis C-methylase UbiE